MTADLLHRFKADMWAKIAAEMEIPWRAAEAMHWQMGENEMARRAGVTPFTLTNTSTNSTATSRMNPRNGPIVRTGHEAPRSYGQQLPSLAELTAGLPAHSQPPPGYPYSEPNRTPGTPYSTLPFPRQSLTPPPGSLPQSDYFLRRP